MADGERFWDKVANRYAKSPIRNVAAYETTMERTRSYLSADDEVLEVGCGTGSTALLLSDGVAHIRASDISSRMIAIARDKAKDRRVVNVTFVKGTLEDPDLAPESFDVVLAFNVLHLLDDIPEAVDRIGALLKPEGLFISKTVCMAEKSRLWRILVYVMRKLGLAPHVCFLKIDELERLVADGPFRIIETGDYPPSPPSRFIVARKT